MGGRRGGSGRRATRSFRVTDDLVGESGSGTDRDGWRQRRGPFSTEARGVGPARPGYEPRSEPPATALSERLDEADRAVNDFSKCRSCGRYLVPGRPMYQDEADTRMRLCVPCGLRKIRSATGLIFIPGSFTPYRPVDRASETSSTEV